MTTIHSNNLPSSCPSTVIDLPSVPTQDGTSVPASSRCQKVVQVFKSAAKGAVEFGAVGAVVGAAAGGAICSVANDCSPISGALHAALGGGAILACAGGFTFAVLKSCYNPEPPKALFGTKGTVIKKLVSDSGIAKRVLGVLKYVAIGAGAGAMLGGAMGAIGGAIEGSRQFEFVVGGGVLFGFAGSILGGAFGGIRTGISEMTRHDDGVQKAAV